MDEVNEGADVRADRALRFLKDVRQFSQAYLPTLGLPPEGSPNGSPGLDRHGVVVHYTVDESAPSVLRWLCAEESESSAHFVIAQDRLVPPAQARAHGQAYDLPASIVQLRPLDCSAWHATWANKWSFGIEICNGGEIRHDATGLSHVYRSGKGWTPCSNPYVRNALHAGSRSFCGYSDAQLYSLKLLLHALCQAYRIPVSRIFGHDNVQGRATPGSGAHDKRDPGPAFDLGTLREMITATSSAEFDTAYRQAYLESTIPPKFDEQSLFETIAPETQDDWALRCQVKAGGQESVCQIFWDLNYFVDPYADQLSIDKDQLMIFQKMMGITVDGILGPATRAALCLRHADRLGPAPIVVTGSHDV